MRVSGSVAMLGDDAVAVVEEISSDVGCGGGGAVERVVDVGLELTAAEFPEIIGGNKGRTVEKRALAVECRYSRQPYADIAVQGRVAPVGEEVGALVRQVFASVVGAEGRDILKSGPDGHGEQLAVPYGPFGLP